jgi:hypothetical protein
VTLTLKLMLIVTSGYYRVKLIVYPGSQHQIIFKLLSNVINQLLRRIRILPFPAKATQRVILDRFYFTSHDNKYRDESQLIYIYIQF